MAVVVTVAKGYDLGYIWKTQGQASAERTIGGYYVNAAQAGEPPGRWWGPGAQALGFTSGHVVERKPYDAVYQQRDPRTGAKLGRADLTSPALLLLAMPARHHLRAASHMPYGAEYGQDRFYVRILMGTLIVSVTFVRIGDGRESSSRSPCGMYQLGWRKGWLCSREQVGS